MHLSVALCAAWSCAVAHAIAFKRDIQPAPANVTAHATFSVDVPAETAAYVSGLALSGSPPDDGNVTADAIRLVEFNGCSAQEKADIYSGWAQAQKIMKVDALKNGKVDFNTAGALEYLGPAGLNSRQGDFNTIFKNFATLTPATWPFGWRIHVRCDNPACKPSCKEGGTTVAYTTNRDKDSGLARINFCPPYFDRPTLDDQITDGKTMPAKDRYNMNRYWYSQGFTWAHELMHIDWVTGAFGPNGRYGNNQHVTDMIIQFTDSTGRSRAQRAYTPAMAKILARWPRNTGDYTIQNADNLALFMTSQYVQAQLGNAYPHFPLINVDQPDVPPTRPKVETLFTITNNGTVTLNETNPLAAGFVTSGDADLEYFIDEDQPNPNPMVFSSFAPDSAYPSAYISTYSANLASQTWQPDSIMTAAPTAGGAAVSGCQAAQATSTAA